MYVYSRDLGNSPRRSFILYNEQAQQYQDIPDDGGNTDYEECNFYESIDPHNSEQFDVSQCPAYQPVSHVTIASS